MGWLVVVEEGLVSVRNLVDNGWAGGVWGGGGCLSKEPSCQWVVGGGGGSGGSLLSKENG